MIAKVELNKFGFYQLKNIPSNRELKYYYTKKYYKEGKGPYSNKYSKEEIKYFNNKVEQKYFAIQELLNKGPKHDAMKILDVGCGEGWALKYFKEKDWKIIGLDYTKQACKEHNPECLKFIRVGDLFESIHALINEGERFNVIFLDNVLEHIAKPLELLEACAKLVEPTGILMIEVPNDFSYIQNHLLHNRYISKEFWVVRPDHISYFNNEGLTAICRKAGWLCAYVLGDYPIDFNLFNPNTNYVENPAVGKSCHQERIAIENMLHSISPKKTNTYYKALADLGLGRNIIAFFQRENMEIR